MGFGESMAKVYVIIHITFSYLFILYSHRHLTGDAVLSDTGLSASLSVP